MRRTLLALGVATAVVAPAAITYGITTEYNNSDYQIERKHFDMLNDNHEIVKIGEDTQTEEITFHMTVRIAPDKGTGSTHYRYLDYDYAMDNGSAALQLGSIYE